MPFLQPAIVAASAFLAANPIAALVVKSAAAFGLQYVVNSLRPDQPKPQGGTSLSLDYGADRPREVCFGRCMTAGQLVHSQNYDVANKYVQRVIVVSHYPIDRYGRVALDGEYVTLSANEEGDKGYRVTTGEHANYVWIKFHDGRQTVADPGLLAHASSDDEWDANAVGTGVAYVVVTQLYDLEAHYQSPQCLFEVYGARLYDWRKDSTVGGVGTHRWDNPDTHEYSANPAMVEYNYRRGLSVLGDPFCGMHMAASDLPIDKFTDAANICDEDVGGEPRFEVSLIANSDAEHRSFIEAVAMSSGAMVVDGPDGSWPVVGTERETVATLYDSDLVDGTSPIFQPRRSMADLANSVAGTYSEPENLFAATDYDPQTDAALLATDRRTRDAPIDFRMVNSKRQGNQLAATFLSENRFEKSITGLMVRPRWRCLEVGDWIEYASAIWGTATYVVKARKVISLDKEGPRNVVLELEQRDNAIYATAGVATPVLSPPADATTEYLSELQIQALEPITADGGNGFVVPAIFVSWAAITDPTVKGVEIEYRLKASPDQVFTKQLYDGKTVAYLLEGIVQQSEYEVRTRLITTGRQTVPSAWGIVMTSTVPIENILVSLTNIKEEAKEPLRALRQDYDKLIEQVQVLAASIGAATAEQTVRTVELVAESETTKALVIEESSARADSVSALASDVTAVQAEVGNATAGGLYKLEAQAGSGAVNARFSVLVKASIGDNYVDSGLVVEVYTDGGTQKGRVTIKADQFVLTDGSNTGTPLVFEDGVLKSQVNDLGTVTAALLKSPDGMVQFDVAGGALIFRGS